MLLAALLLAAGCSGMESEGGGGSAGGSSGDSSADAGSKQGQSDAEAGGGKEVTITIKDFAFEPSSVEVSAGDQVTWVNEDSAAHTATATDGAFDTGNIPGGESRSATVTTTGTLDYVCEYHPRMKAQLDVS